MQIHDSGARQQFTDGAQRDTAEGKPQMHLLSPYIWEDLNYGKNESCDGDVLVLQECLGKALHYYLICRESGHLRDAFDEVIGFMGGYDRICEWLRLGAEKYSKFNWARGMPMTRCFDSLGRHICKLGLDDEDHLAAVACNIMFLYHYHRAIQDRLLDPKWNDLPDFITGTGEQ